MFMWYLGTCGVRSRKEACKIRQKSAEENGKWAHVGRIKLDPQEKVLNLRHPCTEFRVHESIFIFTNF